jgi:hypothetical protein
VGPATQAGRSSNLLANQNEFSCSLGNLILGKESSSAMQQAMTLAAITANLCEQNLAIPQGSNKSNRKFSDVVEVCNVPPFPNAPQ